MYQKRSFLTVTLRHIDKSHVPRGKMESYLYTGNSVIVLQEEDVESM